MIYTKNQANEQILEFIYRKKTSFISREEVIFFKNLIKICDINIQDKMGWNPVMFLIYRNSSLNFQTDEIEDFLNKVNLNQQNKDGFTVIMFLLYFNKTENIHFTNTKIYNLLNTANFNIKNNFGANYLNILIMRNKSAGLYLDENQMMDLISRVNINEHTDREGNTIYSLLLRLRQRENIELSVNYLKDLWKKLDKKNKYDTIKNIGIWDNEALDAIHFLVFELGIHLHKNIQNLLKKSTKNTFLKTIEKRNLMIELEEKIKSSNIKKI
jgi:hypothetical protein